MAILLIRHGETDANARGVLQRPEVPLSARGRDQARQLGRRIAAETKATRILSSDLARAAETAAALAEATGLDVELEPLLQERNFGDLRGRPYAELGFNPFAPDYAPPGGETWARFWERVERAWARLLEAAEETDGDLAVVTHGLVCRAVVQHHAQLAPDVALPPAWPNTSLTVLEGPAPWRVARLNCTEHLDVVPVSGVA